MKIDIKRALELFDERHPEHKGLATPIISMLGEDLSSSAFQSYMSSKKRPVKVMENKFQAKGYQNGHGPRLDRWFISRREKRLYQCEIKNFCSWATNGVDINNKGVQQTSNDYWRKLVRQEFSGQKKYGKTSKVLVEMDYPSGCEKLKVEPLLMLWWPISQNKKLEPFFSINISKLKIDFQIPFKRLFIFSVSLYLRKLLTSKQRTLELQTPNNFEKRLKYLNQLIR